MLRATTVSPESCIYVYLESVLLFLTGISNVAAVIDGSVFHFLIYLGSHFPE